MTPGCENLSAGQDYPAPKTETLPLHFLWLHHGFRTLLAPVRANPPRLTGELSKGKRAVQILNPQPGGNTHTSRNRAARLVRRGIAMWKGDLLEFIPEDHRCQSAAASAANGVRARLRYSNGSGFATLDQIAGLPVIKPATLILGKPTAPPAELPETVELTTLPMMVSVPPAAPYKWPLPLPDFES